MGIFVRYPIFVDGVENEHETWGFRYRNNASAVPWEQLPASARNCSVCYNATTKRKW